MLDDYKSQIRAFVMQYIQNPELNDEDDLFGDGHINSLFAMQLVHFVENTFKIQLGDDDLKMDNFKSISALAEMIIKKSK